MADGKFTRVGDVLPAVLRRLGLERRFEEQALLKVWPDVVGREIAARTEATRIDRGVLYVRVDHGAWMQQLHFIEKELIARLRKRVPGVELEKIRFGTKDIR